MTHEIRTIGVVGAGQMGSGIAQVAAVAGYNVLIHDVSRDRMNAAIGGIDANLARLVGAGKMTEAERAAAVARLGTAETYAGFTDADLVVEAAVEDEAIKRGLLRDISKALRPDALLATNTSSISITRLAAATDRPEKFIGIHFMNPVPKMELVEIIRGIATADATFEAAMTLTARLNKTAIRAEDFPAFIVNRVLVPMINEAIYALHEGVGTVDAIDTAMRLGAHHPMGPLQLADFIGLDTCLSIMQVLHEGLADSKYRPCPLLVKYVEAGWLGKKTGRGFYDYSGPKPVPTR
jgi:3-hydroxybutyryl-CoA dehydrogenase